MDRDISQALQQSIAEAAGRSRPLQIIGGNSKAFYGREVDAEPLQVAAHRGIRNYAPTELVVTARAGTPLAELEQTLAAQGQMLPFEPPHFGDNATLGGTVATNLSGPRRPYAGAVRDHVLGVKIINGKGEILHFGGEVMKNVAGYDLSRLMAGALGTLGVLLEVSFKVIPQPPRELTLYRDCTIATAIHTMNQWAARPYPISAALFDGDRLYVRFSGSDSAVQKAHKSFGGDPLENAENFWRRIREHRHGFFEAKSPLWRLSVAPAAPALPLEGKFLIDWGGGQRWYEGKEPVEKLRSMAAAHGDHATLFRGGDRSAPFQPLDPVLLRLHRRLKQAMDPHGILNPGKMYADI